MARGRPRIEIDYKQVEQLAAMQCTDEEIAAVLGVERSTIKRRKKDDDEFCTAYKKGQQRGKASLRRMQFKAAEGGNATMLIWLGKQYLGQSDKTQQEISGPEGKPVQVQVDLSPLSEEELRVLESITKRLEFRTVQFLFLPTEADRLRACLKQASEALGADEVVAMRLDDFDRAVSDLAKAQMSYNVQNSALGMMLVLDVFERHQTDLAEGWGVSESNKRRSRVPLASVFGGDTVPVDVARTLKRAVDKMVARKEVEPEEAWRCLEQWATKYLEGE